MRLSRSMSIWTLAKLETRSLKGPRLYIEKWASCALGEHDPLFSLK
jgi:hypothetical protein